MLGEPRRVSIRRKDAGNSDAHIGLAKAPRGFFLRRWPAIPISWLDPPRGFVRSKFSNICLRQCGSVVNRLPGLDPPRGFVRSKFSNICLRQCGSVVNRRCFDQPLPGRRRRFQDTVPHGHFTVSGLPFLGVFSSSLRQEEHTNSSCRSLKASTTGRKSSFSMFSQ